jgi:hypothetical protein
MRSMVPGRIEHYLVTLLQRCKTRPVKTRRTCPDWSEMKTGTDVIDSGLYVSECCSEEVWLEKDQTFPRCWICKGLTQWETVDVPRDLAA